MDGTRKNVRTLGRRKRQLRFEPESDFPEYDSKPLIPVEESTIPTILRVSEETYYNI